MGQKIKFYRLNVLDVEEEKYIAASSLGSVYKLAELMGDTEGILERVSEEEASQAKYYPQFLGRQQRLCRDGTWVLGPASKN